MRKIKVIYKSMVQDGNNPDKPEMYHVKEFDFPVDAYKWVIKQGDSIGYVEFVKNVSITVDCT